MKTGTGQALPARLEAIRRGLERWRQGRHGRSGMPAVLWASAVKAAGRYGLNPTARALGLDYKSLQRRVAAAGRVEAPIGKARPGPEALWLPPIARPIVGRPIGKAGPGSEAPATFVESASPAGAVGPAECVLELENAGGTKMRIHLKGVGVPDLAALSRSLWDRQA